jgi:hypothetical protein
MAKSINTYEKAAKLLGKKSRGAKVATSWVITPANPERTAIDVYNAYRIRDVYEGKYNPTPALRIFPTDTYVFPKTSGSDAAMAQFSYTLPFSVEGHDRQLTIIGPYKGFKTVSYRGLAIHAGRLVTPAVPHTRRAEELKKEFASCRLKLGSFIKFAEAMKAWEDPAIKNADGPKPESFTWIKPFDVNMMGRYIHKEDIKLRRDELAQHFLNAFRAKDYDETCLKIVVQSGTAKTAVDFLGEKMAQMMGYHLTTDQWLKREYPDFNGDSWWEKGENA